MEEKFDAVYAAIKEAVKDIQNHNEARTVIEMAAKAVFLLTENMSEELARKIVFRVADIQKECKATLTFEERVEAFIALSEPMEDDEPAPSMEDLLAMDNKELAEQIDTVGMAVLEEIVDDYFTEG